MNLVIWGPPGVGKSAVGKVLSKKLNRSLIDTDSLIETLHGEGLSYSQVFRAIGEARFREFERQVIESIGEENQVISLGGGATTFPSGTLIYLNAPLSTLWTRIRNRKEHPTLELLQKRISNREYSGDLIIETEALTLDETVAHILKRIEDGKK